MLNNEKIRYLLVGCFNTLAGYSIGVGIYAALKNNFDIVLIGELLLERGFDEGLNASVHIP